MIMTMVMKRMIGMMVMMLLIMMYDIQNVERITQSITKIIVLQIFYPIFLIQLYTPSLSNRDTWNEFDEHCRYQPAEEALLTCLADGMFYTSIINYAWRKVPL